MIFYLYLIVMIAGLISTPVIVGYFYEKDMKNYENGRTHSLYPPDLDEHFTGGVILALTMLVWPLTIALAVVAGVVYALFSLPRWMTRKVNSK